MDFNRRDFVLTSLSSLAALTIAGCETQQTTHGGTLPGMPTDGIVRAPAPSGTVYTPKPAPRPATPPVAADPLNPLARSTWTTAGPDRRSINPMNGVNRITIHHDGLESPLTSTNIYQTKSYLELIRRSHANRGWSDIGYHYAVDKAGRIWEARDIRYQGAHVKDNNEHNIGVLVMGNFNIQTPTDAQLTAVANAVATLRRSYKVAPTRIYTHREIGATSCPGAQLQPRVNAMRARNMFA